MGTAFNKLWVSMAVCHSFIYILMKRKEIIHLVIKQLTSPFPNISLGGSSFIQKNHSHGDSSIDIIVVKETIEMFKFHKANSSSLTLAGII